MKIEVIRAQHRTHHTVVLELPEGANISDAAQASQLPLEHVIGYAVFGQKRKPTDQLCDGDRVELLEGLQIDPKQARRLRAIKRARMGRGE